MEEEIKTFKELTEYLSSKFVYIKDKDQYDVVEDWRIMEEKDDGKFYGDCDDFALWMWYHLKDEYYIDSRLIFCEVPNGDGTYGGHLVVESNGCLADNNHYSIFKKTDVPDWKWIKISDEYMSQDGWRMIED